MIQLKEANTNVKHFIKEQANLQKQVDVEKAETPNPALDIWEKFDSKDGYVGQVAFKKALEVHPELSLFLCIPSHIRQEDESRTRMTHTFQSISGVSKSFSQEQFLVWAAAKDA